MRNAKQSSETGNRGEEGFYALIRVSMQYAPIVTQGTISMEFSFPIKSAVNHQMGKSFIKKTEKQRCQSRYIPQWSGTVCSDVEA